MEFNSKIDLRQTTTNLPKINLRQTSANIPTSLPAEENSKATLAFKVLTQAPEVSQLQNNFAATDHTGADILNYYNQGNLPPHFSRDDETSYDDDGDDFHLPPSAFSQDYSSDVDMMDVCSESDSSSEYDWMDES